MVKKLPVENLTLQMIDQIDDLCKQYRGKHKLHITLLDMTNRTSMPFYSATKKVNVDNDFVQELEGIGVEYLVE